MLLAHAVLKLTYKVVINQLYMFSAVFNLQSSFFNFCR